MSKFVFFLGGYDAEMVEIRNILKKSGNQQVFDNELSWGACLSSYREDIGSLSEDKIPVFIELKLDCPYPEDARIIDHHDEKAGKDKKTSIEQVADLLCIKLDRHQQLISANDKGHIPGMRRLCATKKEIDEIRTLDRKAQGVLPDDEDKARKSVENHLEKVGDDTAIVESLTNKTSTVFDMIYDKYRHIFLYTPDKGMSYSGTGEMVCNLKNIFDGMQSGNPDIKYWSGGELPQQGYFGTNHPMERDELKTMLENWNKKIISQHVFMFPFKITNKKPDDKDKKETLGDDKSVDIESVFDSFIKSGWKYREYNPKETPTNYSEYFYFHEYVRNAIFETKDKDHTDVISYYFDRETDENSHITFDIKNSNGPYKLQLNHLSLRLFETGIGVVAIELLNYDYPNLDDVLLLNDVGRRLYPQFLSDFDGIESAKNSFLSNRIVFECKDMEKIDECLSYDKYFSDKIQVAGYMEKLLGDNFLKDFKFVPVIDDRMYTVCWYGSDYWSQKLGQTDSATKELFYEASDEWYQFMFLDGRSALCFSEEMKKELIKKHTYKRWAAAKDGTFYGITRYSIMCLGNQQGFSYHVLRNHMESMYYQIAVIVLAQRASILKYAADVTEISGKIEVFIGKKPEDRNEAKQKKSTKLEDITNDVKKLHSAYIRFINRLWYTEVTPQDQGIEMYNMALKSMGLKEQVQELQGEIKELYEFVSMSLDREQMILDRKSNEQMKILTILGAIFLPVMVLTGFFGMNLYFIEKGFDELLKIGAGLMNIEKYPLTWSAWIPVFKYIPSFFSMVALFMLSYWCIKKYIKNIDNDGDKSEILKSMRFKYFVCNKDRKNKNNSRKGE